MRLSPGPRARRLAGLTVLAITVPLLPTPGLPAVASTGAGPTYSKQTLHFKVKVGPNRSEVCDIVGDLYLPRGASATNRVPAILATNGFGGSKDDQAGLGRAFSSRGYAVL